MSPTKLLQVHATVPTAVTSMFSSIASHVYIFECTRLFYYKRVLKRICYNPTMANSQEISTQERGSSIAKTCRTLALLSAGAPRIYDSSLSIPTV